MWEPVKNEASKCILIDVRTEREWETVGKPDSDQIGLKTYFVSIKNNEGSLNGNFVNDILSLNIDDIIINNTHSIIIIMIISISALLWFPSQADKHLD